MKVGYSVSSHKRCPEGFDVAFDCTFFHENETEKALIPEEKVDINGCVAPGASTQQVSNLAIAKIKEYCLSKGVTVENGDITPLK